jgi:hypothetical protein
MVVMLPVKSKLTLAYALSGLLAVLLLVSSNIGLLYGGRGLYDSYPASLAGLVGQDTVTLGVGVPLLVASMWLTAHRSTRGLLLLAGTLFYFAYSYYFYVVGGFNALFLIYIARVSTSPSRSCMGVCAPFLSPSTCRRRAPWASPFSRRRSRYASTARA